MELQGGFCESLTTQLYLRTCVEAPESRIRPVLCGAIRIQGPGLKCDTGGLWRPGRHPGKLQPLGQDTGRAQRLQDCVYGLLLVGAYIYQGPGLKCDTERIWSSGIASGEAGPREANNALFTICSQFTYAGPWLMVRVLSLQDSPRGSRISCMTRGARGLYFTRP